MSGQQIGQAVGAAVGVLLAPSTAGASLLWAANGMAIGGAIGGLLMPDQVGLQDQAGPRLNDLKVSSTTYGASITRVFGAYRIGGNLIWALPIQETKHVEEQEVGKGGGSESYDVITYTYSVSFAIALCEGPIDGVRRIWADSALIYDFGTDASVATLEASTKLNDSMTLYKGDVNQSIDWLIQASEPDTPAYRNVAYIVFNNLQLASYGDRIPNITVEVVKSGINSNVVHTLVDALDPATYDINNKISANMDDTSVTSWRYSNGDTGTVLNPGHIINSCYYNRGSDNKSMYYNGSWTGTNVCTFKYYGESVKRADFVDFQFNYYVLWKDKLKNDAGDPYPYYLEYTAPDGRTNGDTIVALYYNTAAYSQSLLFNAWSDDKNVTIRRADTFGNVFVIEGFDIPWYRRVISPYFPGGYVNRYSPDTVQYRTTDDFKAIQTKSIAYKKELYIVSAEGLSGFIVKPHIWVRNEETLENSEGQDIIIGSSAINTVRILDAAINNDKFFILKWETDVSYRLEVVVFSLSGVYLNTISINDNIDLGIATIRRSDYALIINSFKDHKLQVTDNQIVVMFRINETTTSSVNYHTLYKLAGNTDVDTSYYGEQIGKFLIGTGFAGIPYTTYLQYCSYYNASKNTLRMKHSFSELIIYFDIIENSGITLGALVFGLLLDSGLDQLDIDTSEGDTIDIDGFVIENVSNARSAIATLQSIYLFDLVEENFVIKLKLRKNSTVVANIDEDDLILNNSVEIKKQLDTELPKKITVSYANNKRDYLKGTQSTIRIDGNSDHNINHDLPIAFTDDEAKNLVEQLMYSAWAQKTKANFNLPLDVNINISDLVTLNYDGIIYTLRVMSITYEKTEMQCVCIGENLNNYSTFAIAQDTTEGFTDSDVYLAGDSFLSVFNSPTLSNTLLDAFGIHYAASGVDPWKGASIIKSNDLGQTYYSVDAILANVPLGEAYGLASGPTTVWDLTNTLRLRCVNGDKLISLTEAQVLSGENYMIVGSEVIQFKNVTPQANGDYIIDTLLRGRRGTEWAVGAHGAREPFIFLTNDIEFSFSTINIERSYKAVTFGTYPDDAIEIKQTYDGTNLKPFAPVSLELNGDIITWVRRDRYISGYLRTLPNSEQQEKYKVELFELGISVFSFEVDNDTTYTYDSITYPNIDTIQVSQYSDNLMDYGYIAEILV